MALRKARSPPLCLLAVSLSFLSFFFWSTNPPPPPVVSKERTVVVPLLPHAVVNQIIKKSSDGRRGGGGRRRADCDLFDGKWVRDYRRPAYGNTSCRTLPDSKNCGKYGKDQDFVHWRWKPDACVLPPFDAAEFLRFVRGRTMAFVGDSVARNQMDSLLCLLSQVDKPLGESDDGEEAIKTWHFRSHNFTVMQLWTKFLVSATERVANGSGTGIFDLHLDRIDSAWAEKIPRVDFLIVSDGHWLFRKLYLFEKNKIIGCVYCSDAEALGVAFAARSIFRTAVRYISECEGCGRTLTLVRTFAPAHFENGAWDGGGYCNRSRPSERRKLRLRGPEWEIRSAQMEAVKRLRKEKRSRFGVLDVTKAMMMRPDAHPGLHWNRQWMNGYSDCVHWCLPGAVDTWNEMLLALLKRGDRATHPII